MLSESMLCLHICQRVTRCMRVWICPSVFGARPFVCRHVFVCLARVMWHGGHFCQIQHPGPCCDVKGTVKRQPRGSTGTAALSALFPPWRARTHTHTHRHWRGHTDKHIHASCKLTHSGGKAPPRAKAPGLYSQFKTNAPAYLLTICWLMTSYVMLHEDRSSDLFVA